ncbi:MAG: hypothetical protein AB1689_11510 [Thermodesulfobacteriota bacterium]
MLAAATPGWTGGDAVERAPREAPSRDAAEICREVAAFCLALDRAAAVVARTVGERGLGDPTTLARIAQLAALAKVGDGYERDGAFIACGDEIARSCGASVARAMESLAEALRHADEETAASERDGT